MRFLCAARKFLRMKQKAAVKRIYGGAAKGIKKPPAKKRGAGVKLEGKGGAGGGEKFAKCKPIRA